jgi:hypothetical protein
MLTSDMLTSKKGTCKFKFLGSFAKFQKAAVTFITSVSPSAWNISASTGQILAKLHTSGFFKICPEN